ncbi:hypothetical protein KY285_028059 [Solanum tuberosum]|nr:hypothetical protein KY285_028059 [Solanum tuberosum]
MKWVDNHEISGSNHVELTEQDIHYQTTVSYIGLEHTTLHPNISSQSGAICLDILKDQWSPALTLKTALLSIQALLSAPEPDDPQDAVVAQQYLRDHQTFVGTARYWTETFAKTSTLAADEKLEPFYCNSYFDKTIIAFQQKLMTRIESLSYTVAWQSCFRLLYGLLLTSLHIL